MAINKTTGTILIAATIGLSACGGNGINNPASIDYLNDHLAVEYTDDLQDITRAEMAGATASLSGNIALANDIDPIITVGDINFDANFDTGEISGTADGFASYDIDEAASDEQDELIVASEVPTEQFTGSLTVAGLMDVDEVTFGGTIDGILTDTSNVDYLVETDMLGVFGSHPDDGLIALGLLDGTITPEFESPEDVFGFFIAQEN